VRIVLLVVPFRVFGIHRSNGRVSTLVRSLIGSAARSEYSPAGVAPLLV
jgi:hypothetical protein